MAPADLVAVAFVLAWVLWFGLPKVRNEAAREKSTATNDLESATALIAALHAARSFEEVTSERINSFSDLVQQRLSEIGLVVEEFGVSAVLLVQHFKLELEGQHKLKNKFSESMAPARTTAWILLLMPVPILSAASAGGLDVFAWFFKSPIGFTTAAVGMLLNLASWRFFMRADLKTQHQVEPRFRLTQDSAALFVFIFGFSISPTFFGFLFGIFLSLLIKVLWQRLQPADEIKRHEKFKKIRTRAVVELASGLSAGLDWKRSATLVIRNLPDEFQAEWNDILQRIAWGVPVPQAFSEGEGNWRQISVVVDQSLRTGAPLSAALLNLADQWQQNYLTDEIVLIEKKSSKFSVGVTLFQLPAFILVGLVPVIAASLSPLFEIFA
jgi:Flp pilus assembly protein TadB